MSRLTIQEPYQAESTPKAYGIDLGTTHSLIAQEDQGAVEFFADALNETLLPSCVHYGAKGEVVVGCKALEKFQQNCPFTYRSIKRLLGKTDAVLEAPCTQYTAQQASTQILQGLVARLPQQEISAVITVPAYFNEVQRQLTKQAAQDAGIEVLRLLNEPTAAAVAYRLDNQAKGKVLVFDFGGGTFDVSVLDIHNGVIEVLATKGDTQCGGDDLDAAVVTWLKQQGATESNALLLKAKQAKERLSEQSTVTIEHDHQAYTLSCELFNQLIHPVADKLVKLCQSACIDAKLAVADLNCIVCVGGSSRIPYLQQCLQEAFGCELKNSINPDQVVAHGAAIQASILSGHRTSDDCLLLDVAPLSLGIETYGGLVEKMIPRNTRIPVQKMASFTTQQDGQSAFSLRVVQGEREFASDNQELAHFYLKSLPRALRGEVKIDITFTLDKDGLLEVSATTQDLKQGITQSIKPTFGMSAHDIKRCIEDAVIHADADVGMRLHQEKAQQAKEFIQQIYKICELRSTPAWRELQQSLDDFSVLIEQSSIAQMTANMQAIEQRAEQLLNQE